MNTQEVKFQNAKKRVAVLKGFYAHLTAFIVINAGLILLNLITSPGYLWFFWPLMGWGIAVVMHAVSVMTSGKWLSKDWEEKKIQELMDRE